MDFAESSSEILAPWNGPAILLVDLDAFFASVEQLDHPAWRGKPVVVGGDPCKHGVVSTASYEARKYGIKSAMPSSMAASLCPHAIWTPGRFARYKEVSRQVMSILLAESPYIQQISIDEAFLDVSPTNVNHEHPVFVADRIQRRVSELGITCSIGVGTSKTVAKIASDLDKPCGLTTVWPGNERDFLASLPVRRMSGIGKAAEESLARHGIRTLGQVATADAGILTSVFGKNGETMRRRCLGEDHSPVVSDDEVKSVSNEVTLAQDARLRSELLAIIDSLASKVGRRLRQKKLAGTTVALKIKFADRTTRSAQQKMPHPVEHEAEFIPVLHELLGGVWNEGSPVRLIGVSVSGFSDIEDAQQCLLPALFPPEEQHLAALRKAEKLARATDAVKDRFGESSLMFGRDISLGSRTTGSAAKNPADYK